jgi:AraC-like DNA-binding protein
MDVLTDILNTLRLKGSLYFRTELTAPWGIHVPAEPHVARFHIVIRGDCWLRVEGQPESLSMANGDLIVIPHGAGHDIVDDPTTPVRPLDEVLAEVGFSGIGPLIYGGGGPGCSLVCGQLKFDNEIFHTLLDNLPATLHIHGNESYNATWLDSALGFIGHEAATEETGALAIIDRLSEIIFIQVIRAYVKATDPHVPFLAALGDPQISRALSHIHHRPDSTWTVAELGRAVGMSRSAFSNRFSELVGLTPHQYLTIVRMQKAAQALATTQDPLVMVAESAGYQSEAAFSTTFKRHFGIRPGEYRRQRQEQLHVQYG